MKRRAGALLMSLILVMTSFTSYAEDALGTVQFTEEMEASDDEGLQAAEETVEETEGDEQSEQDGPEQSGSVQQGEEETEAAEEGEAAEEEKEEETAEEEEAAEEEKEVPLESETEVPDQDGEDTEEIYVSEEWDGIFTNEHPEWGGTIEILMYGIFACTVTATVPENAFTDPVTLMADIALYTPETIGSAKLNAVLEAAGKNADEDDIYDLYVADISFIDENGDIAEPASEIQIKIDTLAAPVDIGAGEADVELTTGVYHYNEETNEAYKVIGEVCLDGENNISGIEFSSKLFSPFVVLATSKPGEEESEEDTGDESTEEDTGEETEDEIMTLSVEDGQVINGYGRITVTDQQTNDLYTVTIRDVPTNTRISLGYKNIEATDADGNVVDGVTLAGGLYYVPEGEEENTDEWTAVSFLMLNGSEKDDSAGDEENTFYVVELYDSDGEAFDMAEGSLYLKNATIISARADIMPIQKEILCAQDNSGNYSQSLVGAAAMSSNTQAYFYPGYEDDIVSLSTLTNGRVEEFYYGDLSEGVGSLTECYEVIIVKDPESGEYRLCPLDSERNPVNDTKLYMVYDEIYSFDVIVNNIVNEHTEDNGDVYLWRGTTYYVDKYHNQGGTSNSYTNATPVSGMGANDFGVWVQLARLREPLINSGTKTFADYSSVAYSSLSGEGVTSGIISKIVSTYDYGIAGPYYVADIAEGATGVTQSTVRITGHIGDEYIAQEEFGTSFVYMVTDTASQFHEDWIDLGAHPSDDGTRSWWYWINDYYKLNNYQDELEYVEIVRREDGQVRLEADEMGASGKGELYDIWSTMIFTKRESVIKADLMGNQSKYKESNITFNANAALPHHVQLRMNGTVETVGEDGEVYSGKLTVLTSDSYAPHVKYDIPTAVDANGKVTARATGESDIEMANDQETEIYYFQTVSGGTTTNYYVPSAVMYDADEVKIDVRICFTGEVKSTGGKTISYTEDNPLIYEGTLTEAELREGYDTCPNSAGYDFALNLSEVVKADVDTNTELILYKVWDDDDNAYGSRGNVESVTVTLERSKDGETWETVMDKEDSSSPAVFTISAPEEDPGASQWSCSLTSDDLDLSYMTQDNKTGYYEFRIASEKFPGDQDINSSFSYNTVMTGTIATNTLVHDTVDITGEKLWLDDNGETLDADEIPDDHVIITLYQNGHYYDRTIVSKEDGWEFEFKELPKWNGLAEYVYTVSEMLEDGTIVEDGNTILIGNDYFTVSVKEVTDEQSGETNYTITNTRYAASGGVTLTAKKEYTGAELKAGLFSFTIKETTDGAVYEGTGTNDAEGKITFTPAIEYTLDDCGTHTYEITETKGSANGVAYDPSTINVMVIVSVNDKFDGTLSMTVSVQEDGLNYRYIDQESDNSYNVGTFYNTYEATGGVTLTATKKYTGAGAKLAEDLFSFTIKETTKGADYEGTGTNDADGNISFEPSITYTLSDVGTHTYEIAETEGSAGGVTYDSSKLTVTVVVNDNGDGTLSTTVTAGQETITAGEDGSYNAGTFENSYRAAGSVTFGGEKRIEGRDTTNQQFTFALYNTGSDFTVSEDAYAADIESVTGAGSFTFDTIYYDSDTENGAGTYYYLVKETSADGNGWTMDRNEYRITVIVSDAGDGTFTIKVTCVDAEGNEVELTEAEDGSCSYTGLDFCNTYRADKTSVQFAGMKYITNSTGTEKVFTFELYETDQTFDIKERDPLQTTGTEGTITDDGQTIQFNTIEYDETGTYYYVIKEKTLDPDIAEGWTIDSEKIYKITVEVKDNGLGQLNAEVKSGETEVSGIDNVYGGFDFTNEYEAKGEITLGVVKSVSGVADTDEKFSFTLYGSDENFITAEEIETICTEGKITNSTELNFAPISFTYENPGIYYYIIRETGSAPDGWMQDSKEYHVTVTATDNGDGTITTYAVYEYTDEYGEVKSHNAAEFTNTYSASGSLTLAGKKTFTGSTLEADSFTYSMTGSNRMSVGDVTMDADGNITFPTLEYDQTDIGREYTYTITETNTSDESIRYDDSIYTVVVGVSDNKDGTLDVTYKVNGTENGDITFTNYKMGNLTVTKTFTGLTYEQIAALTNFKITVKDSNGDTVGTLTLDEAAKVDEGGSYSWTISNLPSGTYFVTETGYSLDGYEVIANSGETTVTDGSDLTVSDTLNWGGEDTVGISNSYTEVGSLSVSKHIVEGTQATHLNVGYTVVITAQDDNKTDFRWVTVKDSDGKEITSTCDAGTVTFTIKNNQIITVSGLPAGRYEVSETVADNTDYFEPVYFTGDVETEEAPVVTVASGEENIVSVEIWNEYPIATYIMVEKNYNNTVYPGEDDAFTFTIEALSFDPEAAGITMTADDMPLPASESVTVTDSYGVSFGPMTFEHLGTYYYKITETDGGLDYIEYDPSVYYVKIAVRVIGNSDEGYYVETAEESYCRVDEATDDYKDLVYTKADNIFTAVFENTYSAAGCLTLTATKEYTGADLTDGLFEFTIRETTEGADYTGTGTNDADGNIIFIPEIEYTFDDVGIHTYEIRETAGNAGGVTYDTDAITVTVVVTDNADGTLKTAVTADGEEIPEEISEETSVYCNAGTFKNSYRAAGSVTFGGNKVIEGIDSTYQTFTFNLYRTNQYFDEEDAGIIATKSVTGAGSFTFDTIYYDSDTENGAGTYYYLVKETSSDENGWTTDKNEYHITVDAADNGSGTILTAVTCVDAEGETVALTKKKAGENCYTGLDFKDTYKAEAASVQFAGMKYITNSAETDKVFSVELYETGDTFTIEGAEPIQTKSTDGTIYSPGQKIEFDTISYEETGTHYYVIKEKALDDAEGWTIDSEKIYKITVEVEDNGLGQLSVEVKSGETEVSGIDNVYGGFDFTNEYEAEGEITLGVVKSVSGVTDTDKEFSFTLYGSDEDFITAKEIETICTEGKITNSTELNFTPISFTHENPGIYYYIIRETGSAPDGWMQDSKEYHVTVTATDNGDGTITTYAVYKYTDEYGEEKSRNAAEFTNTYSASGLLSLSGTKILTGGNLATDAFTFTMKDSTLADVGDVSMDADGNITFPELTYDETDIGKEYIYFIAETDTENPSFVYDTYIYTLTVSVSDNTDGTLDISCTVDGEESKDITFTNYQKGSLLITKTFTGLTDGQIAGLTDFNITVTDSSGVSVAVLTLDDVDEDDEDEDEGISYTWTVSDLAADKYTVTEAGYSLDGYEVIARSGEVTVTDGSDVSVYDNLGWGDEDFIEITNDYTEVGTLTLSKYVIAEEDIQKEHEGTQYTVVITAAENTDLRWVKPDSSSGRKITPVIDGNIITFTIMEYETVTITGLPAGDYQVKETGSDAETSESFVPVYRIGEEEHESAPTVTVSSGDDNIVSIEIDNEYPIATYIQVQKEYNNTVYPKGDAAFTFTVEALSCDLEVEDVTLSADEMPVPENSSVTITQSGETVSFGTITYEHLGTYYYRITETKGSNAGIKYDGSVHYIKVVVASDEATYVESTDEYEYIADGQVNDYRYLPYTKADGIVTALFKNTYSADGSLKLAATKEYTGADLTEGLFEFTITETTDPDAEDPYSETVGNDARGNITFTPVSYEYDADPAVTDVGLHTYVISEAEYGAGGVTYDDQTITVTVNVIDNGSGVLLPAVTIDGRGLTSAKDGSYNVGTFKNSYRAAGSVTFGGTKKLQGRDNTDQIFTFALYTTDDDFETDDDAEAYDVQSVRGAGNFTFETILYDSDTGNGAGTYYYLVKETSADENGWTGDETEYHITVIVSDAGDGTFALDVSCRDADGETVILRQTDDGVYSFTGLDFTDEYEAEPVSVQFLGEKYITNSTGTEKVFTFELYTTDESFVIDGLAPELKSTGGQITGSGQEFMFDEIEYTEPGIYCYVIREQAPDDAEGWTVDPKVYNITVTVEDDGIGHLAAEVTADGSAVAGEAGVYGGFKFVNEYAAEGNVTPGVVKSVSGVASTDESFEFTLYESDESFAAGNKIETITTDGTIAYNTELNFDSIPYGTAGTYYYIIRETGTAPDGWMPDTKEYHVTVTAADNGDGTITTHAVYAYTDENGGTQTENAAEFTNTYAASGLLSLTGTKILTGGTLDTDEFTFTMKNSTGESAGEATMDADGNIIFPALTYDQTDIGKEYTYFIRETNTGDSSFVYDDRFYEVVVSVEDNKDGTLDISYTVDGEENKDIIFTNCQKGSLSITKAFTGLTDEQIAGLTDFNITVTDSSGRIVATLTMDDAAENEDGSYSWTVRDLAEDTYTVTESGYSLDGYEVIAKSGDVIVTDGSDVSVDDFLVWGGKDTVAITNDYTEVGTLTLSKYVIAGDDIRKAYEGTEYTVVITAADKDADFRWVTLADSDGSRKITPVIEGNKITFTIMEYETVTISGLPAGDYKVEETGSDDQTSESFVPIYRIGGKEHENAPTVTISSGQDNIVFIEIDNEYPIATYIQVQKEYNNTVYPQGEDAFTFTVEALGCDPEADDVILSADEMPVPENSSVTITQSGETVSFGLITYEHLGTYYYRITETKGSNAGIKYDGSVHYVKVVVAADEETYAESADEYEYIADEKTDDYRDLPYTKADGIVTAVFKNTYSAEGSLKLSAAKEYTGADLTEGLFEFTITETTDPDAEDPYSETVRNDAGGNITFTPIRYEYDADPAVTDVGRHTYVISEVNDDAGGVTYDDKTISVTVIVTDNGDGTLDTTVTADNKDVEADEEDGSCSVGTFRNSYRAAGSVTFGGTKKLEGRDSTYQTFTFALYAADDDFKIYEGAEAYDIQSVTGAGDFTFKTIPYDSDTGDGAGTYYYLVKETSADENGWTADETEYRITVIVSDAGDGTFTLDVSCADADGETVTLTQAGDGRDSFTGLDFCNSYKAAETSVQFTGRKYISNSLSTDKVFTFELYEADDEAFDVEGRTAIQTLSTEGTITSDGQEISFDAITYDEAGTYYYVMKEQTPDEEEGWTIDDMVYYITVEVKDDGLGQLNAAVTADGVTVAGTDGIYGGFDFDNGYTASGEVILGVVKSISGVAAADETFCFTLYESDEDFAVGKEIETVCTDGTITNSTEINFTAIPYEHDLSNAYPLYDYFVIKETGTAPDGWTLDEKEYHVTVTVTDDGTGTLTAASYIYIDKDGIKHEINDAHFVNTYAASGELELTGTKILTGGAMEMNEFTFTMTESSGESVYTAAMDADGTISFPALTYDQTDIGKVYTYFITETDTENPSFVYDDHVYHVVVSVDDNKDGTLDISCTVDGEENKDIIFTNYQKGSLLITKSFTGLSKEQIESLTDFTVTVTDGSGSTVAALTTDDAEKEADGSYRWIVKDLPEGIYTVTETGYDAEGCEVVVTGYDGSGNETESDGTVSAEVSWGEEAEVKLINKYTGVGAVTVTKYLIADEDTRRAYEDTEYTVIITADEDADFQWVTLTSDSGRVIEPEIDEKTITFTIMEYETVTASGLPAGSYTVEEQGPDEGQESDAGTSRQHYVPNYCIGGDYYEEPQSVTVEAGSKNVVSVQIGNEYPIGTCIMVQKEYNRDVFPDGGFSFEIGALSFDPEAQDVTLGADEMPMPENEVVTTTQSGETGYFENMTFEHLGTYYYRITETKGSEDDIAYDESVHYIKVVVSSDETAHTVSVDEWESRADAETDDYKDLEYTRGGIVTAVFTNTAYEELSIEKEVSGRADDISEYEFEITLTDSDGTGFDGIAPVTVEHENEEMAALTFDDGKASVTLTAGEKVTFMIPSGLICTVTETTVGADTTTVYADGKTIVQVKGTESRAAAEIGVVADSTLVKFVNSYRQYFPIDEEIVTDMDDIFNKDAWVKEEAVNEYNAIEIEMTTNLPLVTAYDLENGSFTMNFHDVLDHELVLDKADADFSVYIAGKEIDHEYYNVTVASDDTPSDIKMYDGGSVIDDGCSFHVDVYLTKLYRDGIVTEDMLDGSTEITVFFFADLEGTGLNGSYKSTVWYEIYDDDELLYTSNEDVVDVYTYEIEILKYDASALEGDDYPGSALAGAVLGVYYDESGDEPVSRSGEPYTAASGDDGMAIFYGLADGTYYIKEIASPEGYVLSDEVMMVTLNGELTDYSYKGVFANIPEEEETEDGTESESETETEPETESETEPEEDAESPDVNDRNSGGENGSEKESGSEAGESVQTGDNTPLELYFLMMMAAAFLLISGMVSRRRKANQ